ncbi:MAG: hypothetical protein HXX08_15485 [Chloroflexi bacterium]|uniref:Uncharacterized protein n=1 Tax=Candidatus Chlorohelix allophototropha TaxID=3003348 RepID=A0A8T7M5B4_9CHLR|nr:hypothetical protein [Chloroflexota bacterium]WJW69182.1 hypothetical protein OZ401_002778 [Chloroflexota bacterium L227-S17]
MREVVKDYQFYPGEYPVVVVSSKDSVELDVTNIVTNHNLNPEKTVWIEHILAEKVHGNDTIEENWEFSFCHNSRDRLVLAGHHNIPDYIVKALVSRCQ